MCPEDRDPQQLQNIKVMCNWGQGLVQCMLTANPVMKATVPVTHSATLTPAFTKFSKYPATLKVGLYNEKCMYKTVP